MGRRARKVYQVSSRVQLVLLPGKKRPPLVRRARYFFSAHQKPIGIGMVLIVAFVLVLIHQRHLAELSVASVAEEAFKLMGEVLTDRMFPGGEFTKEVG